MDDTNPADLGADDEPEEEAAPEPEEPEESAEDDEDNSDNE